jgi:hypothetical protein
MVSARVRRQQVAYVCNRGLSVRRACALMSVAGSTLNYQSRLIKRDAQRSPQFTPRALRTPTIPGGASAHFQLSWESRNANTAATHCDDRAF